MQVQILDMKFFLKARQIGMMIVNGLLKEAIVGLRMVQCFLLLEVWVCKRILTMEPLCYKPLLRYGAATLKDNN